MDDQNITAGNGAKKRKLKQAPPAFQQFELDPFACKSGGNMCDNAAFDPTIETFEESVPGGWRAAH